MLNGVLSGSQRESAELQKRMKKAVSWIRKEMNTRWDRFSHPSHIGTKILEEANRKFNLESFGVEGWASKEDGGRTGVSYLNYGDPYYPTIGLRSWPNKFTVGYAGGGWSSYADN